MKKRSKKTGILIISAAAVIVVAAVILVVVMSGSAGRSLREQLTLGDRYLSEMDYEKALAAYRAAIEIDPGAKEAYEGFTLAYLGWAEAEGVGTPQAAARLEQAQSELEAFRSEDNTEIIEVQLSRILERMALLKAAKEKGEDDPANDPVNNGNADKGGGDGVGETPTEPAEDPNPTEAPEEPTEAPTEEVVGATPTTAPTEAPPAPTEVVIADPTPTPVPETPAPAVTGSVEEAAEAKQAELTTRSANAGWIIQEVTVIRNTDTQYGIYFCVCKLASDGNRVLITQLAIKSEIVNGSITTNCWDRPQGTGDEYAYDDYNILLSDATINNQLASD